VGLRITCFFVVISGGPGLRKNDVRDGHLADVVQKGGARASTGRYGFGTGNRFSRSKS